MLHHILFAASLISAALAAPQPTDNLVKRAPAPDEVLVNMTTSGGRKYEGKYEMVSHRKGYVCDLLMRDDAGNRLKWQQGTKSEMLTFGLHVPLDVVVKKCALEAALGDLTKPIYNRKPVPNFMITERARRYECVTLPIVNLPTLSLYSPDPYAVISYMYSDYQDPIVEMAEGGHKEWSRILAADNSTKAAANILDPNLSREERIKIAAGVVRPGSAPLPL